MPAPRLLHTIWFQGADRVPPRYAATLARLREKNPGWRVLLHDAAALEAACAAADAAFPDLGAAQGFRAAPSMIQKIDLGRYAVLLTQGGVTCDLDVEVLRGFDELPLALDALDSLLVSRDDASALEALLVTRGSSRVLYNNSCLIAPPLCPAVAAVLRSCAALTAAGGAVGASVDVHGTTGARAFTRGLLALRPGSFQVLPPVFFEPCLAVDAACVVPPEAVLLHRHDNTWLGPCGRRAARTYFALRRVVGATAAPLLAALLLAASLAWFLVLAAALARRCSSSTSMSR